MRNFFLDGTPEQNRYFLLAAAGIFGSFLTLAGIVISTHFGGIPTHRVEATPTGTTVTTSTITLTPTRTPNPTSTAVATFIP